MPPSIVARRAAEIRDLLDRGALVGLRVPLRNGGTLPAEMFAKVALDDLACLSAWNVGETDQIAGLSWQRFADDIELLHQVVLAREHSSIEQDRIRA